MPRPTVNLIGLLARIEFSIVWCGRTEKIIAYTYAPCIVLFAHTDIVIAFTVLCGHTSGEHDLRVELSIEKPAVPASHTSAQGQGQGPNRSRTHPTIPVHSNRQIDRLGRL